MKHHGFSVLISAVVVAKVLFLFSVTSFLVNPALGAYFKYEEGTFGGQRGAGMLFGGADCPDPWIGHWSAIPDPNPSPAVETLRCSNSLAGDARVTTRQMGQVSAGESLSIWNHGQVEAIASSVGTRWWEVFSLSGNQAHADSSLQKLGFRIMPDTEQDEAVGDPVWLTFNANYLVNHSIGFPWTTNYRTYSQWTNFVASDTSRFEVKGILDGPYPAPFTVYLREDGAVRDRPVLRAKKNVDRSSRIFNGERIPAHIGDLVLFDGGVLPWLTIDARVPVGGGAYGSETATSDMTLDTHVSVSEAEEFELSGPLIITSADRSITCLNDPENSESPAGNEPWDAEIFGDNCYAHQASEISGYWLSAEGNISGNARSFYQVVFTLEEASPYQLYMILDGSSEDGVSSFELSGPTVISYTKSHADWWVPIWETGVLLPGDYILTVQAQPEGISPDSAAAWFDFDLTFGEPTRVPPPPPPGTVINATFAVDQKSLADLGFTVTAPTGTAAIVSNPIVPEDDGALQLQDPGDGAVIISTPITGAEILKVELEYLFQAAGKLEIGLGGAVLDTVYAQGPSPGFVFYTKEFALSDYGLTPGELLFTLKLSNPDAVDPEMYLDNLLVSTGDSYSGNAPPSRPVLSSPADGATVDTQTPTLVIANSTDENGDAIRYAFQVFADPDLTALVAWATDVEPGSGGSTEWVVDESLQDNATYYWRVIATDQREANSVSAVGRFQVNTSGENRPPVAVCQDRTVSADSSCQADASVDNGSYDPDGDSITLVQAPPGPYGLGSTAVTLTVTDAQGASAWCTGTVTVVDTTAPTMTSVVANPNSLWPPNHKMRPVTVAVSATDNCGSAPVCQITSVSSDEQADGDWQITSPLTVNLRAERDGGGDGRVYTITVTRSDEAGNSSTGTTTITVPHDQGRVKK